MVKNKGKTHAVVARLLRQRGFDPKGLEVVTLSRGSDHLVLLNAKIIGEYNHISKRLFLYNDVLNAPE